MYGAEAENRLTVVGAICGKPEPVSPNGEDEAPSINDERQLKDDDRDRVVVSL